ncbi:integrase, catalytic region, zinc finger, CCHC-type containing protein [Tanacetum coccineum]|uniref:Integrase, catalytic region, zinc finger, CCHC-type containing protein n=1 Tax=Tanacetum coccineum TaxID=301880 RepID=A0ABQ5C8U7_9ASTR
MAVPISTKEPKHNVNQSVATSSKKTVATDSTIKKSRHQTRKLYEQVSKTCSWWYPKYTPPGYNWKPKSQIGNVNPNLVEIILFIVDFGCSKHMTGNLKLLTNFVEKFLGMVKFGNDQIAPILGYGDLVQGTITIKRVYYVEGLNHNLFSVGQFCDADLEVAFQKSTCFIRDLKGNDLLTGSRGIDLYSITLQDSTSPNPICLMAKATSSQAWLWHRRLSHLNFDTINLLSKNNIVNGLLKLKFVKDHLCSSYGTVLLLRLLTTMLSTAKVPLFFWAEAIATACFTQNRSLVIPRHKKTPYHIINARKPSVKFFHIFGSLCYIVRDGGKTMIMKENGDACIYVGLNSAKDLPQKEGIDFEESFAPVARLEAVRVVDKLSAVSYQKAWDCTQCLHQKPRQLYISWQSSPTFPGTKHIDDRYHFIKDQVKYLVERGSV